MAAISALVLGAGGCAPARGPAPAVPEAAAVLDDFADAASWTAIAADGVELTIHTDEGYAGRGLRLDFHFAGGGYAVIRKPFDLDLPENYAFSFRLRGQAPTNHLEFKLVDVTGENVWWYVRRDMSFAPEWQTVTVKKRQLSFAWGPQGGGEIHRVAAIEFAVTAGTGGTGTVWFDDLELRPLAPPGEPLVPFARASSWAEGHEPARALDGDTTTWWEPEPHDGSPWLVMDFRRLREYGGLVVRWVPERHAPDYAVEVSDDGESWRAGETVTGANGGRDALFLPESESRYVRLRIAPRAGRPPPALAELAVQPLEWSRSPEAFFQALAAESPRGDFPRGISGEQVYWTVVGVDGDPREGLLSEDGMLETGKGSFSIEPFLFVRGRLATWADVRPAQSLLEGVLPLPTVTWWLGDLRLEVTACGTGPAGASSLVARYRVANGGREDEPIRLFLALRPFQVNPPAQFLNLAGGCAPVHELAADGGRISVDGRLGLVSLTTPCGFGAMSFHGGELVADYLREGTLPPASHVQDAFGAASGVLAYDLEIAAGATQDVVLWIPLHAASASPSVAPGEDPGRWAEGEIALAAEGWRERLGRVRIEGPDAAAKAMRSLRSQLAYILVNRAGPAIQPGVRSYARSWIRDGALTSSALLRLGHPEVARGFLEWYAAYQYPNGKAPCVVDARGADPTPEHDSSGQFIFLVTECYRHTGDRELLERFWPAVARAADYLDSLRRESKKEEFLSPGQIMFFGLLPPSISHEGYSAKPMHSYWDDFFALRGFEDAAFLAGELGRVGDERRLMALRDEFRLDLAASVRAAMHHHGIDYVPGCADLGDFDPTSTAIALTTTGSRDILPAEALRRTFEKYYDFFLARRDGAEWEAFTPYEMRTIGAFVRLGWRERAHRLLDYFLGFQRPPGWHQWPEVVWRESRVPRFLGDLPHTWVGSEFARSLLDMLVYERREDAALVLGAGVPPAWLDGPGLAIVGLPTPYGSLSCTMRRAGEDLEMEIAQGLRMPPGGLLLAPPEPWERGTAFVNGNRAVRDPEGKVDVPDLPAVVRIRPAPAAPAGD